VWDGDKLLFEFNWQAFHVPPAKCFEAARRGGREQKKLVKACRRF
jgi:hypothetical protein